MRYIIGVPEVPGEGTRKEVIRMKVQVIGVVVSPGETIGIGWGHPVSDSDVVDETKVVEFAGDWRPMAGLALMGMAAEREDARLVIDIPDWSIREIREL